MQKSGLSYEKILAKYQAINNAYKEKYGWERYGWKIEQIELYGPQAQAFIEAMASGDPEKMYAAALELKNNADLWQSLTESERELINEIIDGGKELERAKAEAMERLLQTSQEDIEDVFREWLRAGEMAADELADYFEEVMRNALIESIISEKLRPEIDKWLKSYEAKAESDEELTDEERDQLRKEWQEIINMANTEAEGLNAILGEIKSVAEQSRGR